MIYLYKKLGGRMYMSQAKVDQYKKLKADRKKIMKKEKMKRKIEKYVGGVLCVAVIGWLGFSVYHIYESSIPREVVEVDYQSIDTFFGELYE